MHHHAFLSCFWVLSSSSYAWQANILLTEVLPQPQWLLWCVHEQACIMRMGNYEALFLALGIWGIFGKTALLTLGFCYNYEISLETSCAVIFLPQQPGSPQNKTVICRRQMTTIPWDALCMKKPIDPIKRLALSGLCPVPSSDRGGRHGTILATELSTEGSGPRRFWARVPWHWITSDSLLVKRNSVDQWPKVSLEGAKSRDVFSCAL